MKQTNTIDRTKLDRTKLAKLKTGGQVISELYGANGTPQREEFNAQAKAWYFAELLKEERKAQNITQQQLADKVGKKREYITQIERGKTCVQLDTFLKICGALNLNFQITPTH